MLRYYSQEISKLNWAQGQSKLKELTVLKCEWFALLKYLDILFLKFNTKQINKQPFKLEIE